MDLSPLSILFHIVNVVILFLGIRLLLIKPIKKFMQAREDKIAQQLAGAEQTQQQARDEQAKYQQLLACADEDSRKAAEQLRQAAQQQADAILAQAQQDAQQYMRRATAEREESNRHAQEQLKRESVALAVEIAGKILQQELTGEMQQAMIDRYLEKVG